MPSIDLTNDHLIFDGLEQLLVSDASGVITIVKGYKLQENTDEEAPSEGVYQSQNVVFQLPSTIARAPEIGGTVTTTDGVVYTIVQITKEPWLGDYWGVLGKTLELNDEFSLVNVVALWRAVVTTDAWASKINSYPSASVAGINAKIQLMPSVSDDLVAKREFVRNYEIFVDLDLPDGWMSKDDILKDESGTIYTIVSWRNRFRIDELSVIIAQRTVT